MINQITELFSYEFLRYAMIVGALVSVCASLLGVTLVLKRYSMIGDGLSHVGFGALSIALSLGLAPLKVAIPIVIIAAFLLLRISESSKIKGDAAIALISTASLATGIIATSLTKGFNIDIYNFMFGSILSISRSDVYLSVSMSLIVLVLYFVFYNRIFTITFDESFAKASGINTRFYDMVLAFLTAITIVIGMRIMGTLLISSLIIFPALTSMQVFSTYRHVIISSVITSVICFFAGIIFSYYLALPAGASVVAANMIAFSLFYIIGKTKKSLR